MNCLLYLISPPQINNLPAFAQQLDAALSVGGVGAFQLRLKSEEIINGRLTSPHAENELVIEAARILLPICKKYNIAFLLNDNAQLAKEIGADGVHLGQEDGDIASARKILGDDAVIGATCHASRHLAMEAGEQGADYVAFGAFFPTTSKTAEALEHWGTPTPEILQWWSQDTVIPCAAIGGITPQNCAPLVQAGADFLAVISYIWQHPQGAATAVAEFNAAIRKV